MTKLTTRWNRARRLGDGVIAGTLGALLCGGFAASAAAGEFSLENGVEGRWSLDMSVGASIRDRSQDPNLIMKGNGGNSGSSHDDGNLNYDSGDVFSTIAKAIGELQLKRDNYGIFLRAKAWYDFTLEDGNVPHGSSANGYARNGKLNDGDFDRLSRFSGIDIADAYIFTNTTIGDDHPFAVKFGNHVVNWGESLFIAGINQFGAFDIAAARRPGAQVKEVLLPIPQISANLGLTDNLSVEGFYQLTWRKNILDGCGTYWSISDVYNCSDNGVAIGAGGLALATDQALYGPTTGLLGPFTNAIMKNAGDIEPSHRGQWGLAARYFVPAIATEFGAYYANYHQRSPIISALGDASPAPSVFSGAAPTFRIQYAWDWSAEDIKVLGLSFSTGVGGWSVFGEVSRTKDLPVQLNGLDLLRGATTGQGPLGFLAALPRNVGLLFHGYDLKDKTQVQVSTLKIFPRVAGAESLTLLGEVAYQRWSDMGDPFTSRRYGRAFVFGQSVWSGSVAGATAVGCAQNTNAIYCETEGFATTSAWGYRVQGTLSYPDVFAGINLKPRIFWAHDVKGYSADSIFVQDRQVLSLGMRMDYLSKYYADISYTNYNRHAKYDVFHDRDFYSLVVGVNF